MVGSDEAVLARARSGDQEAFRALVEQHSRSVFRLAHRMTGNEYDAEDVVQETFLRAYRQLGRFEARADFGTWLYRIAANCSFDLLRTRGRHSDQRESRGSYAGMERDAASPLDNVAAPDPAQDRLVFSVEVNRRVTEALEWLSPMERAAFTLRHFEGMSIEEIGRTLGLRTNATKHSIFRAVRKMRAALQPVMSSRP